MQSSRWYTNVSRRFLFLPSRVVSNLVMILIVAFGQASSQAVVQPVQACSFVLVVEHHHFAAEAFR